MKNRRLILLGIDGMDFDHTWSMLNSLHNIKRLSEYGMVKPFKSVFPPDSIPSWITCFTGKDPSEHGILESVNYLAKKNEHLKVDTSVFQGRTFWDIIGSLGIEVCVINPFMAYPVWPVNGVMINGPVFIDGDIQVSDPSWVKGLTVPKSLGGIVDFPTKKTLRRFVEKAFSDTMEQAKFGLSLLEKKKPGLFFQTFLTMDRIQHFLWRYCDKKDPTYPGKNPFKDVIDEFYILIDRIIGNFLESIHPEDSLMVFSDHGHGMRCTDCFNINELLRKRGYLQSSADGKWISCRLIVEKLKNSVLNFMNEHNLEDYISVVARFIPNAKSIKKGKHITDLSKNKAYASDFTGTNPFGGICINTELVENYEGFRNNLINEFTELKHEAVPVFDWIRKREDMFSGPFLDRYPDILFSLKEKYGVNWSLHTPIYTVNPTHKKISGGHREYGTFITSIPSVGFLSGEHVKMSNLFATVLDCFGINWSEYCDEMSFLVAGDEGTSRK